MHGAITWSYDLLNPAAQQLFRRLAVFAGGCTSAAATAISSVAGGSDGHRQAPTEQAVLDQLRSLVDQSLLQQASRAPDPRFQMLETLREYAEERLRESGEIAEVQRRHTTYYVDLAEQAEAALEGPQQDRWLERIEADHENIRAVLHRARDAGEGHTLARLSGALWLFWHIRGYWTEGRQWLEIALTLDPDLPVAIKSKILNGLGNLAMAQDDYGPAQQFHRANLRLRRAGGARLGVASTLYNLGNVLLMQGEIQEAQALLEEGLALAREEESTPHITAILNRLGYLAHQQARYSAALAYYQESLTLARRINHAPYLANCLSNLGDLFRLQRNDAQATLHYRESLALCRQLDYKVGSATVLFNLGALALTNEDADEAAPLFQESLQMRQELGSKHGIAVCLIGLAGVANIQADAGRAAVLLSAATSLLRQLGSSLVDVDQNLYDAHLARTQAHLDPETWETAWRTGAGCSLAQAIALAVGCADQERGSRDPTRT
jgi:tetratricopeptide (TPR) repeat protein